MKPFCRKSRQSFIDQLAEVNSPVAATGHQRLAANFNVNIGPPLLLAAPFSCGHFCNRNVKMVNNNKKAQQGKPSICVRLSFSISTQLLLANDQLLCKQGGRRRRRGSYRNDTLWHAGNMRLESVFGEEGGREGIPFTFFFPDVFMELVSVEK